MSNAIVQYKPTATNSEYQLILPITEIENNLTPLILEAKNYLYNKGFNEYDIQEMLLNNNGKEMDLIPFVMALIHIESSTLNTTNYSEELFTSAYAKLDYNDYIHCAVKAIGIDILMNLGSSTASSWSIAAMKKAFGVVAKRMLGPIGVTIAAISFFDCLYEANHD